MSNYDAQNNNFNFFTDGVVTMIDENGQEVLCDFLCSFDHETTGNSIVVYTDNTINSNGSVNIYASVYTDDAGNVKISPIEDDRDWKAVHEVLDGLISDMGKHLE